MRRQLIAAALASLLAGAACAGGFPGAVAGRAPKHSGAGESLVRVMAASSAVIGGDPGGIAADRDGVIAAVDGVRVVAIDRRGRRLWSTPVAGAALGWPWIGHGLVVVPTIAAAKSGGCVALDRSSGARRWSYRERDVDGVAVGHDGENVYCALSDGVVVAVNVERGARQWRAVVEPGVARSSVAVSERTAFAFDEKTRTLALTVWIDRHPYLALQRLDTGASRGLVDLENTGSASAPASIAPGLLAVGASDPGEVCIVDLRGRRVRSPRCLAVNAPTGFDPAAVPVVSGNTMVITSKDGWVIAIDVRAVKVRWSVQMPAPILDSHPAIVGDAVVLADWARVPWLVRLRDGRNVTLPRIDGSVVATVADPPGGFDLAVRGGTAAGIERWALHDG